jgi:hypothetical protein
MLPGPFEKLHRGALKLFINLGLPSVVIVLIHGSSVQAQYPRLDVPAWDQMNDPLVVATRGQICFDQCILELPEASRHVAAIGVDCYDKRALSTCRATPISPNGGSITRPDPLFATAPSARQVFKIKVVLCVAEPLHVLLNKPLVTSVLGEDDNLRSSTHAPIRERLAPLEISGFSGRRETLQPEQDQWPRERIVCRSQEPTD